MKRRDFIKKASILSGACASGLLPLACKRVARKLPAFGIIIGNTGGKWFENDPKAAFQRIAELGYQDLEFGGDFGMGKASLKAYLKELKLRPLLGPTSIGAITDTPQLMKDIRACQEMDMKYIVCYWPWTDGGENKTVDDWKRAAETLNKGGEICRKEGLKLLYHNHNIEFKLTEGQIPFDVLMSVLDPDAVNIELDLYWIIKGNHSAEEYIKKYPGRYPVFHVKDMDGTPQRDFEYVGKGIIDFPSIFKLNEIAGAKHFIVEHDKPADPEVCIATAAAYLSEVTF